MKRISESVLEMYKTDSEIRFTKKKFVKRISESVSEMYERIPKSVSQKRN